jgi:hypothetical protein
VFLISLAMRCVVGRRALLCTDPLRWARAVFRRGLESGRNGHVQSGVPMGLGGVTRLMQARVTARHPLLLVGHHHQRPSVLAEDARHCSPLHPRSRHEVLHYHGQERRCCCRCWTSAPSLLMCVRVAPGNLTAAQILYPLMQCTDIFFLRADICQLGVDQRKVPAIPPPTCVACDCASGAR